MFGDPDFKTVEIIMFQAALSSRAEQEGREHQLHHAKVLVSIERTASFDFDFSDEVTTFQIPYVYFMHQNFVQIISPITNTIVKTIDFGQLLL